jgi:hypothetical protein
MTAIDDPAIEALTRSFLLGTARNPIPTGTAVHNLISAKEPASELTTLALVGQRLRFRRHSPPPEPTATAPIDDKRKIVPEAARPLIRRLVGAKDGSASDVAALALADACHRLRLRPHPFDLPRLAAFARAHGEALGAPRRWAAGEYAGIGLDAMAAAFGLPIADMIAAAADDAPLLALFARQASIERRFEVLAAIVREQAVDAWIDAIDTGNGADGAGRGGTAELPDDATMEQWCTAALAPELWPGLPSSAHLDLLYGFLRRPLPPAQARELLRSRAGLVAHDNSCSPSARRTGPRQ